ncbi:uncharacterized protein MEPE_00527 [Melanopsichium pennsylvanicum]|uniref:Uncharacterized protein n=2 Tax=Melanopsichium pennsylvanicum TaxID=63383 RepID=A0AAJ4XGT5_9BASI|nr:conserved hypothetical protein [Melanopsichium pennsylvanicum 4]SNX81822.1 uncharacterized protein MEPE_00527 [Melanopsichium pennsylvanicum]
MGEEFEYRIVYARENKPLIKAKDLHVEVETNAIPPGGVRWKFATRYRASRPSYRNVLLQSILDMCRQHKLTPLEIKHPHSQGGYEFVDVTFASPEDVLKVYDGDITFDFYGTEPELIDRGIPDRKHVAMCVQMLPTDTDLQLVVKQLQENERIRQAGRIRDVWSLHCPTSGTFKGKVLVLLKLHTQRGLAPLDVRSAVPGWFVFNKTAYLVRFADRPGWCFNCRYDEKSPFHSVFSCPNAPCSTCGNKSHSSVQCSKRKALVARNAQKAKNTASRDDPDDDFSSRARSARDPASVERRFAELGIRDSSVEPDQLALDFDVLALSENDLSS